MIQHASEIREKDVINICTGKRLGFICDFLIDAECGRITAIIVSEHFFSLSGGKGSICIPWEKISCIGGDAVLVKADDIRECDDEKERCGREEKKRRGGWFF